MLSSRMRDDTVGPGDWRATAHRDEGTERPAAHSLQVEEHLPSVQCIEENPYVPLLSVVEHQPTRSEAGFVRKAASSYVSALLEDAAPTKTINYVAGFILSEAAAALSLVGLYAHLKAVEFAVSEVPQLLLIAGATGLVGFVGGLHYGFVVCWKGIKERPGR